VKLPDNGLRSALAAGDRQWGMFTSLADPVAAEICAGAGFDFVVIDTEHAPTDHRTVLTQLQAMSAYPVEPVVRLWNDDRALVKRVLDLGVRSILVPMVDDAEQAAAVVAATRYAGGGRGVSSARAARWGRLDDYHRNADHDICVLVQVETQRALGELESIAAVDGVDGVFLGPMDLATSLGHIGEANHPDVVDTVADAIARVAATGTAAGVLAGTPDVRERYLAAGATFVAVGVDTALLAKTTDDLRRSLQ
jgi:4-hydroxy-2-oxoheptanedioate aldolase